MVEMDECRFHICDEKTPFVGTQDLNGCFAVVVISEATKAVLFAHIAPRLGTDDATDTGSGKRHTYRMMSQVVDKYRSQEASFPTGSVSWTVFARYQGEVALRDNLNIVRQALHTLGLPEATSGYDILPLMATRPRGHGEVFVGFSSRRCIKGIENTDVQLQFEDVGGSVTVATQATGAPTSSLTTQATRASGTQ